MGGEPATITAGRRPRQERLWPSEYALIHEYFPHGTTVLDLGCGSGRTTFPLHEHGFDVTGVDINPRLVERANDTAAEQELPVSFRVQEFTDLQFEDNRFHCVLSSHPTWSQFTTKSELRQALSEVHRVLEEDGVFIFTTHPRMEEAPGVTELLHRYVVQPITAPLWRSPVDRLHVPDMPGLLESTGLHVVRRERSRSVVPNEDHPVDPVFYVCYT